jgi:hypothetical protein
VPGGQQPWAEIPGPQQVEPASAQQFRPQAVPLSQHTGLDGPAQTAPGLSQQVGPLPSGPGQLVPLAQQR